MATLAEEALEHKQRLAGKKIFDFVVPLYDMTAFDEFIFLRQLNTLKGEGYDLIFMWDVPGMYDEFELDDLIEVYEHKCKEHTFSI